MKLFGRKKDNNNKEGSKDDVESTILELNQRKELLKKQIQAIEAQEAVYIPTTPVKAAPVQKERAAMQMLRERARQQQAQMAQAAEAPMSQLQRGAPARESVDPRQYAIPAERLQEDTAIGSWLITIYEQYSLSPSQKRALLVVINEKVPWYVDELRQRAIQAQQQQAAMRGIPTAPAPAVGVTTDEDTGEDPGEEDLFEDLTGKVKS